MDGRRRGQYTERHSKHPRPRGDGYESYDYGPGRSGSWTASSHRNGASRIGSTRNCPYNRADRPRHGHSESHRGYRDQRVKPSAQLGQGHNSRGSSRNDYGPPKAVRTAGRHTPPHIRESGPKRNGLESMKGIDLKSFYGGGYRKPTKTCQTGHKRLPGGKGYPPVKKLQTNSERNGAKTEESESDGDGNTALAGEDTMGSGRSRYSVKERILHRYSSYCHTALSLSDRPESSDSETGNKGVTEDKGPPAVKLRTDSMDNGAKTEESESDGDGNAAEVGGNAEAKRDDKEEGKKTGEDWKENKKVSCKQKEARSFREAILEDIQFSCSLCQFRTFCEEEMTSHLQSLFHQGHISYLAKYLPEQSVDLLQEYMLHQSEGVKELRDTIKDLDTTIQQIHRDQDLTQNIPMSHFVRKAEVSYCDACDLFFPMDLTSIDQHLKTSEHKRNRKRMMERSRKKALDVAMTMLKSSYIRKKLDSNLQSHNPPTDEDTAENRRPEIATEPAIEGQEPEEHDFSPSNDLSMRADDTWKVTTCEESSDEEEEILHACDNLEGVPDGELVHGTDYFYRSEGSEHTEEDPSDVE